jgi:hypothetical protein
MTPENAPFFIAIVIAFLQREWGIVAAWLIAIFFSMNKKSGILLETIPHISHDYFCRHHHRRTKRDTKNAGQCRHTINFSFFFLFTFWIIFFIANFRSLSPAAANFLSFSEQEQWQFMVR